MESSNLPTKTQELDAQTNAHVITVTTATPVQPQPRKKRSRKILLAVLLGTGAIIAGVFGYRWWRYTATHQETDNAYVAGDINPINARINGTVAQVLVRDNQFGSQGTPLVQLDPRETRISVQQAQVALTVARNQAAVAQGNIGVVATDAQAQMTQAQGNIVNQKQYQAAQAQAQRNNAQLQLSYTQITALVAGRIGNKNVQVGQRVQPGQA